MGAIKALNSIRNLGRIVGSLSILIVIFAPLSMLYVPADPSRAATVWLAISSVLEELNGRIEIVDGIWILLVTWAAFLAGRLPRTLNYLGVVVGVAGVFTVVPALEVLRVGFGLGALVWVVWLGVVMLRGSRSAAARTLCAFFAVRFGKRAATTQDLTPRRSEPRADEASSEKGG